MKQKQLKYIEKTIYSNYFKWLLAKNINYIESHLRFDEKVTKKELLEKLNLSHETAKAEKTIDLFFTIFNFETNEEKRFNLIEKENYEICLDIIENFKIENNPIDDYSKKKELLEFIKNKNNSFFIE